MESKLYVGNLAFAATEEDLQNLFAQAGAVKSVTIIKDRYTGRSKGFGFVEMETAEDAQKAINQYNGTQLQERALTVSMARPREDRGAQGGGGGRGGFGGGQGGGNRRGGNGYGNRSDRHNSY